jgi:hypothetical protein
MASLARSRESGAGEASPFSFWFFSRTIRSAFLSDDPLDFRGGAQIPHRASRLRCSPISTSARRKFRAELEHAEDRGVKLAQEKRRMTPSSGSDYARGEVPRYVRAKEIDDVEVTMRAYPAIIGAAALTLSLSLSGAALGQGTTSGAADGTNVKPTTAMSHMHKGKMHKKKMIHTHKMSHMHKGKMSKTSHMHKMKKPTGAEGVNGMKGSKSGPAEKPMPQ